MVWWHWVVEWAASALFGYAAAILPVFNNEAYVVGSQLTGWGKESAVILGLGVGNGVGKTTVIVMIRAGKRLPWWRLPRDKSRSGTRHTRWTMVKQYWGGFTRQLLRLVNHRIWGLPLIAFSAATSVPPFYPVTLLAAASPMRLSGFALAATVGSCVRALLLVLAVHGVLALW